VNELERLVEACGSLARKDPDTDEIFLAHYSIKEFLTSDRILRHEDERIDVRRYHLNLAVTNEILARSCLTYLFFLNFSTNRENRAVLDVERLEPKPPDHATPFAGEHLKRIDKSSNPIIQLLDEIFGTEITLDHVKDDRLRRKLQTSTLKMTATIYCRPVEDEYFGIYAQQHVALHGFADRNSHDDSLPSTPFVKIPDHTDLGRKFADFMALTERWVPISLLSPRIRKKARNQTGGVERGRYWIYHGKAPTRRREQTRCHQLVKVSFGND